MSALFVRIKRLKFVNLLGRYWDSFLSTWNVMLHGNPVVNVFGGIKLASSGELGMGVGEEDRGSGEREVLEGFVGRVEGLVDLVVSKFSGTETELEDEKGPKESESQARIIPKQPWLGTGVEPTSDDGAVFLGVGALSRKSLRDITHWMEDLYSWGSRAYGVRDNPTATRKLRKKREKQKPETGKPPSPSKGPQGSPPHAILQLRPAVKHRSTEEHAISAADSQAAVSPSQEIPDPHGKRRSKEQRPSLQRVRSSQSSNHSITNTGGKFVNYLKLGYGTHWSLGSNASKASADHGSKAVKQDVQSLDQLTDGATQANMSIKATDPNYDDGSDSSPMTHDDSVGHYLIGLMGDIEKDEIDAGPDDMTTDEGMEQGGNFRMLLRTVTVELEREGDARPETDISIDLGTADYTRSQSSKHGGSEHTGTSHTSFESQDRNKTKKLRIVVYVNKPFIFTFLFELRTDALALMSLYRSLHYQLSPLQKPLLASTSRPLPRPGISATNAQESKAPIYDLIWDSKSMTISSTIPNIPEPNSAHFSSIKPPPWSRIEALNTQMQLLNTFTATRSDRSELENTCKTSRGWWIVWTRILDPDSGSTSSYVPSPAPGARTPQLRQEDSMKTMKSSNTSISGTNNPSTYSGPAHSFLDRSSVTKERPIQNDKEIFLLRHASDYSDGKSSGRFGSLTSATGESGWGSGTAKLAQGIGVDTKRYIEGLLNMNR
jgi:hypothetical protein